MVNPIGVSAFCQYASFVMSINDIVIHLSITN